MGKDETGRWTDDSKTTFLSGGKARLLLKTQHLDHSHIDLELRGVPASAVKKFYTEFRGLNSREMQAALMNACPAGKSWVEWAVADVAGPCDVLISYSWDLNWE
jgi:hypothetical protein